MLLRGKFDEALTQVSNDHCKVVETSVGMAGLVVDEACNCFSKAWARAAGTGTTPTTFLEMHSERIFLVLPQQATKRICDLPLESDLKTVADEVKEVASSSEFGSRLFSSACRGIVELRGGA
eukprot:5986392-Amphidinium_carterae.2